MNYEYYYDICLSNIEFIVFLAIELILVKICQPKKLFKTVDVVRGIFYNFTFFDQPLSKII